MRTARGPMLDLKICNWTLRFTKKESPYFLLLVIPVAGEIALDPRLLAAKRKERDRKKAEAG